MPNILKFKTMKLSQLKQLIKEEIQNVLSENLSKGYKLKDGEQDIIDSLFKDYKKDKNIKDKEEYKKLSISAKNKLQGMISHEREESGLY